jgi:tRNA pseudouridine32 synthase/23S rRNA pseudouridine746 synthase
LCLAGRSLNDHLLGEVYHIFVQCYYECDVYLHLSVMAFLFLHLKDSFLNLFESSVTTTLLPDRFILMAEEPHPLCTLAAKELQQYLTEQKEWSHNFGLSDQEEGAIIGKMFGVLVVKTAQDEIGYLAAFSGKLAGANHHTKFVPPIFDSLAENGFLNEGMAELAHINQEIKQLEEVKPEAYEEHILRLKNLRKDNSIALQQELFENYHFLNQAGEEKSLNEIFRQAGYKNPPSGAGECAGPKLLQYAFQHQMKPLALAEFWWGQSPKSDHWQHGHFYPCCKEKCEPILAHMLAKIN